jgi:glycosyltransferase involved in cell wall biosynthesis
MKRKGIDVLFSLNSYLPLLRPRRTVLLMQDRCFFHEPLEIRDRMSLTESIVFRFKRAWAFYSMRVADSITVQTKAMADSVMAQIPAAASKLSVIHHGPGIFNRSERAKTVDVSTCLEVAYVAYYRKYKNFPVLFRALKELRERSVPVRLHLTLNPNDRSVRSMLDDAKALGVADLTINHGELSEESVAELYHGVHVFAFPSICESFGLPQVEAMTFGLPVVAADTEVNREICAAAGSYFKADDYKALADRLEQFYRNPVQLAEASKRSIRRGSEFCWKYAAVELSRLLVKEP